VAATVKVAVCPAITLWLCGCDKIANAVVPVPARETPSGEFVASLAIEILPETAPLAAGAN